MAELFECGEAAAVQTSSPGASETSETRTPSSERSARSKRQAPNFMDYVKKELFPEGVDDQGQIGAAPAAKRQRQSNNSSSNSTDKVCKVCGEPAEKNSRYCGREKRSYEAIYRQVTRTRPKGRDKAAEQKEWEANDAQWMAFQQIFGPDGDETVAAKVLLDYSAQFPDCKQKGKQRGNMDLTVYSRSEGIREENGRLKGRPLLDWELFCVKMANKRGWTQQKADLNSLKLPKPNLNSLALNKQNLGVELLELELEPLKIIL